MTKTIMLLVSCSIILLSSTIFAEDSQECFYRCKAEIPNVSQCVDLERKIWDTDSLTDAQLIKICKFMIIDEIDNCIAYCNAVSARIERAIDFYDRYIKNFPETNE